MAFQDYSLIQAPMAGGLSTAEVVAGASRAGALGSVGAGYLSGDAIMAAADGVRAAGGDAFAVNLFIPAQRDATDPEWRAALKALAPCYRQANCTTLTCAFSRRLAACACLVWTIRCAVLAWSNARRASCKLGRPCNPLWVRVADRGWRMG